jgi:hypothetical protein
VLREPHAQVIAWRHTMNPTVAKLWPNTFMAFAHDSRDSPGGRPGWIH